MLKNVYRLIAIMQTEYKFLVIPLKSTEGFRWLHNINVVCWVSFFKTVTLLLPFFPFHNCSH